VYSTDFDTVSPGGITTSVRSLVAKLNGRFRSLLVCVGNRHSEDIIRDRVKRRDVAVLPVLCAPRRFRLVPLNIAFTLNLFRRRRQVLEQADVVHVHRMELALPFILWKQRPVVLTVHGSSAHHDLCKSGLLRWRIVRMMYAVAERFVFSKVDAVVLISQEAAAYYGRRYACVRHKFLVIPNFIDTSELGPVDRLQVRSRYGLADSDVVVVYAGRLSREKRVDLLIAAFGKLVADRPGAHLVIAGDGPEEAALKEQVARQSLSHVRFLGLLSPGEARMLVASANVVVLPSEFEGFPMIVLEALAGGVPVVARDVGGVRDILTEDLAIFMLRSANSEEIVERVCTAVDRQREVAQSCLARAQQFDAARVMPQIEAIYSGLTRN
jgi:glycosyltransferase involved in cell wall biosynthesis